MNNGVERLHGTSLEIDLTEHCNLRCAGCDHGSPHMPERFTTLESFRNDLEALSAVLTVDELKICGGEPLLQPAILDFLRAARESGIAQQLTLITNGLLLHKAADEVWDLVDRMWVSIYPGIKYKVDLSVFEAKAKQHNAELWLKETPGFSIAVLNNRNNDQELVGQIFQRCRMATMCHIVHDGRYYKCSPSPFMPKRLQQAGVQLDNRGDSVALHGNPNLREELERYLRSNAPLASCAYCLGTVGKVEPVVQLNKSALAAELARDHSNVRELIDWEAFENPWDIRETQIASAPSWARTEK